MGFVEGEVGGGGGRGGSWGGEWGGGHTAQRQLKNWQETKLREIQCQLKFLRQTEELLASPAKVKP